MKKIIYDGIISSLQNNGGITVYFKEIIQRLDPRYYNIIEYSDSRNRLSNTSTVLSSRLLERYRDCYLENIPGSIFHSTYYRLPSRKDKYIVTTVHDFTYEKYMTGKQRYIHTWQKYKAIKNSDKIICVSHNTASDLLEYCRVDHRKIEIIHNGVSNNYFNIKSTHAFSNKVIFIGARAGYKNFDKAVHAVSMCKDLDLVIVGGGEVTVQERKLLDEYLNGRYHIAGFLSEFELNNLYNEAYCLLYPSEYEGFGIPILEAMRAGCPVIAVNRSSIPEVAGDSALLVDDTSRDTLSCALRDIDKNRNFFIEAGLNQSLKFSWDRCFAETTSLYDSI